MPDWPNDDLKSKIAFYGNPSKPNFMNTYMGALIPPFQMYYDGHPIKSINVNKKVISSLLRVFIDIAEKCGHDQQKIDKIGVSEYGGCYNYRAIRGAKNLSNHAFAAAIDLCPSRNPLGAKKSSWDPIVIEAFKKENWLWGGDYKGRKDPMHFEAVSR